MAGFVACGDAAPTHHICRNYRTETRPARRLHSPRPRPTHAHASYGNDAPDAASARPHTPRLTAANTLPLSRGLEETDVLDAAVRPQRALRRAVDVVVAATAPTSLPRLPPCRRALRRAHPTSSRSRPALPPRTYAICAPGPAPRRGPHPRSRRARYVWRAPIHAPDAVSPSPRLVLPRSARHQPAP